MAQSTTVATLAVNSRTHQSIFAQLAWIVGFAALTAAGAQVEIPIQPVPITLQTLIVLLSGAVLGLRNGAISQIVYLCAGSAGLPVFAGWSAGIGRILGPTGGYLLAFPVAAIVTAAVIGRHRRYGWYLAGTIAGSLIIFLMGMIQLKLVYTHDWSEAFREGFLIFTWWDAVKVVAAAAIARSFQRSIG